MVERPDEKIKILVVQDDIDKYKEMMSCLSASNSLFCVSHFPNAAGVFGCNEHFDLIITDLKLPNDEEDRIIDFQKESYFEKLKAMSPRHMIYSASQFAIDDKKYAPWSWLGDCFTIFEGAFLGTKRQKPIYEIVAKLILQKDFRKVIFASNDEAGDTFENLVLAILESMDWMWSAIYPQKETFFGHIDFLLEKRWLQIPFWDNLGYRILVECKNYSRKIGLEDLRQLSDEVTKCENCNLGFSFVWGEFKKSGHIAKLFEGVNRHRIIPFDQNRIKLLLRTVASEEKTKLLKKWIEEVEFKPYSLSLKGWKSVKK